MGQSLMKFSPGNEEKRKQEIARIIESRYTKHFVEADNQKSTLTHFYRAVCETVEEINKTFGNTQFRVPSAENLEKTYKDCHQKSEGPLTRNEFQQILREILTTESGFTGLGGAKDTLIYIFGVPLTALFIKERLFPLVVSNEIFIPCVTSATVFTLAKLNKI